MRRAAERFGSPNAWMKPVELTGAAVFLASSDADFCDRNDFVRRSRMVRLLKLLDEAYRMDCDGRRALGTRGQLWLQGGECKARKQQHATEGEDRDRNRRIPRDRRSRSQALRGGRCKGRDFNRNEAKARIVIDAIKAAGGDASAFRVDVSSVSEIQRAIGAVIERYGTISILVNNAAAYLMSPLGGTTEKTVDLMLNTNIKGVFFLCQSVLPTFEENNGGKIINIASVFGMMVFHACDLLCNQRRGFATNKEPCARAPRAEYSGYAIAPGAIETPLNNSSVPVT